MMSYGVNRYNEDNGYPRPFRMIPSGGALYPLELYVYARRVDGLSPGLYHFDPEEATLAALIPRPSVDAGRALAPMFVQPELVEGAAAVIFIAAVFFRSTFKYGARGYRFVLLEAGHLAQNAMITATLEGIGATPIGGFFDREVDAFLALDGVNESTVYSLLLGHPGAPAAHDHPGSVR